MTKPGLPVDVTMASPDHQSHQGAQRVAVADHDDPARRTGGQQTAEFAQPAVDVDDALSPTPAHLADVCSHLGGFRNWLADKLRRSHAVEAPVVLLAQQSGGADGQPSGARDGSGGLPGAHHVAGPQFLSTPSDQGGSRGAGLGTPPDGQLGTHLVAEYPAAQISGGFAMTYQGELQHIGRHIGSLTPAASRAAGLGLAALADQVLPDPPNRWHPVAWFGTWAGWLEARMWSDSRMRGATFTIVALAPVAALGLATEVATHRCPAAHALATALAGWVVIGAGSLSREGELMAGRLDEGDLPGARGRLSHLCGRLPDGLDEPELARATVESLAENTADSAIASLWWGALGGIPGMLVHRATNTLDAMVGYRSTRYARFGTASARLDDLLDLAPARLTAALACALASTVGGRPAATARIVLRDAHDHPSPNGGWCESAWAGALGVQLGGHNVYPAGVTEERGLLGDGPRPRALQVRRAAKLVRRVTLAGAGIAAASCLASSALSWFSRGRDPQLPHTSREPNHGGNR